LLVDYEYRNNTLIVSHVDSSKQVKLRYYKWPNATKYITCDDDDHQRDGKYVTWDGRSVKSVPTKNPNRYSVYDYIDELPQEEQDIIFQYNEPDIFFIDIENEIIDKKPAPHLAESAIQSISIVNKDKVLVMGTQELSEVISKSIEEDINNYFAKFGTIYQFKYIHFKSEYEMLLNFFVKFVPRMPVLTGWNFTEYDWVFLVNRARKLGIDPSVASVTKLLREPWDMEKKTYCELPAHRMVVDYMELFKKWDTSIRVKESISLDFVSDNVLGVKKVNYEGSLKTLYNTDYKKFVYYNAVDSVLVQKIHEKTKLINILYGISTLSRVKIGDSYSTLPVTEGILRRKLKKEKNVVLCRLDRS
jgi:DNA polymerase elongation subunit (family B)